MRLGHHDVPTVPVPRRFYLQLRTGNFTTLLVPPRIALAVARQLKVTTHAPVSVPLRNDEFCKYAIQMEWFHGTLYFMRA